MDEKIVKALQLSAQWDLCTTLTAKQAQYLLERIAELEAATRWIPVEKWLPEKEYSDVGDEVIVLLAYPYSRVATMKFGNDEFYSGGFGAGAVYWTRYVTYWQPLPKPPEVQE